MILGIDLSLTGTGLALLTETPSGLDRISAALPPNFLQIRQKTDGAHYLGVLVSTTPDDTFVRWELIRRTVGICAEECDRVLIEGYAFSAHMAYSRAIAELGGIVRYHLAELGQKPIEVAPASLKKFLTGKGNADKNIVLLDVFKRYGLELRNDNLADAFGLAKIGQFWDGSDDLPAFQLEALQAIRAPKAKKAKGRAA
jgi:crossover junction endodeoxyribonuclease RuvC